MSDAMEMLRGVEMIEMGNSLLRDEEEGDVGGVRLSVVVNEMCLPLTPPESGGWEPELSC